jgi:UrcA family protein
LAGALASSAALAADPQAEADVIVQAERATTKVVERTSAGIPIVQYELRYRVSYADLDLATSAGADTLKKRVHEAARSACTDLDRLYPLSEPDRSCARKAEDGATPQVADAIKLAQSQGRPR